jgi:tol-pal system protein YbgF
MLTGARSIRALVLAAGCLTALQAHALFGDDEARKAILELREQVTQLRQDNQALRRSLLDMQSQIDQTRVDLANLRGQNEQAQRSMSDLQRSQKEWGDRLKQFEPTPVTLDGLSFTATPSEQKDYDAAFSTFRSGDFNAAQSALTDFVQQYAKSGYLPSALFWLGNAQYATKNYREAIANFRRQLSLAPKHARAGDALLSIANCQIELKDTRAARTTLEELSRQYPGSEADQAGKERLARLR